MRHHNGGFARTAMALQWRHQTMCHRMLCILRVSVKENTLPSRRAQ